MTYLNQFHKESVGRKLLKLRRILRKVVDELCRCCELYEAKLRNGEKDVNHLDVEQRVAELYAKENGFWIPIDKMFDLGTTIYSMSQLIPSMPSRGVGL